MATTKTKTPAAPSGVIASTQPLPDYGPAPELTREKRLEWYRLMYLTRKFEERAYQSYQTGLIGGFCHLYNGQEAVAAGTFAALHDDDPVITAYRDHAHGLMRGIGPGPAFAEMYGRATGCAKGKGGSMHFFNVERQMWGGHGIVGGQSPLGLGLAFAAKYLDRKKVCFSYMGDGAVNQGAFHEALNLAQLWEIPVVFVIENNKYSMGTAVERHAAPVELYKRAAGYDMMGVRAEAMDFDEVREISWILGERARRENQPAILELMTYRFRGHSMSDPQTYRSKTEIDEFRKSDPVEILRDRILASGTVNAHEIEDLEDKVRKEIATAHEWALASPYPRLSEIYTDIYA
jgi:pyruvate dehydrogenase E1 component alpha subunit